MMHAIGFVFSAGLAAAAVVLAIVVIVDALPPSRCTCYACARRRAESRKRPG